MTTTKNHYHGHGQELLSRGEVKIRTYHGLHTHSNTVTLLSKTKFQGFSGLHFCPQTRFQGLSTTHLLVPVALYQKLCITKKVISITNNHGIFNSEKVISV